MKVVNQNGTQIEFDAAINLMDDDLCEELARIGFKTEQEFFSAYEDAHLDKFNEEWELSKANPVW